MTIIATAAETYLDSLFLGWGPTRLVFRHRAIPHQLWLAPWFGLMLVEIPAVWMSRYGVGTEPILYAMTILAVVLIGASRLAGISLFAPLDQFDAWLPAGALVTLSFALYPMFVISYARTT